VRILLTILSLIFCATTFAQNDSSFVLVGSYKGDVVDAALDNLDNLYVISSTGQIKKYNAAGDSIAVYNQLRNFGKTFVIDVSNPLKVLLFYKDFSTVVVLDRFLAGITTINLKNFKIIQPAAVGLSYDNNIWVYDEYDSKLKKINEQGDLILETSDLRGALNISLSPQKIINDNGLVYVADTTTGIFVFDNYGSFKRKVPLVNWQTIGVGKNAVVSISKDVITVYNTSTLMQTEKKLPYYNPLARSFISGDKFVTYSAQQLQVYRYR
jgi:hypothetical protein